MNPDLRNADLQNLAEILQDQNARKLDLVVPSSALKMTDAGTVQVRDAEPYGVTDDGSILTEDLTVAPGEICSEGFAERLNIPVKYYKRMRDEKPELLADNVNGWLQDEPDRPHLLRTFRRENSNLVFGRALLSDRFECVDNFDVLLGVLDGVRAAAPTAEVQGADLTERKMRVRIVAPEISANVLDFVKHYEPKGTGRRGTDYPLLFAGLVVENSETGGGAFQITPRAVFQVCTNGQTRSVDALRRIHLGSKMEEGRIDWSEETRRTHLELIRSQARDAVSTFLSETYLERFIEDLHRAHGIEIVSPMKTVEKISKVCSFSEAQTESILTHFMASGDSSALGLAQSLTYNAQSFDADLAALLEDEAISLVLEHRS